MKQRATLVLNKRPVGDQIAELGEQICIQSGGGSVLHCEVVDEVPFDISVGTRDQLEAAYRDSGPERCVFIVWMEV